MTYCLCNHTAAQHGLTDAEAVGKIVAPCHVCRCEVFEDDPTFGDSDERLGTLRKEQA